MAAAHAVQSHVVSKPVLRQAVVSDAKTIAALHSESWRSAYRGILNDNYLDNGIFEERQNYWQETLNAPQPERRYVLLAEQDKKPIAFVSVFLDVEPEYGALLHNLHVLPHLRGQGLGRLLMREAARWTLEQNVKQMHLWVVEANTQARKFYEALGGEVVEKRLESVAGNVERDLLRYIWKDINTLVKSYVMRQRVLCHITRERKDILVFEHTEEYSDSGVQVPGGGIDMGETPEQAALREAFEETGLSFTKVVYLGCKEYFDGMKLQEGHFCWLEASATTPDAWEHFAEEKYIFRHRFVPPDQAKIDWNMDTLLPKLKEQL
jgi:8-oxo-dGTP pyrophosphatase MutT (NUDIX family)/GNAT superfamily N-acetyltransferase